MSWDPKFYVVFELSVIDGVVRKLVLIHYTDCQGFYNTDLLVQVFTTTVKHIGNNSTYSSYVRKEWLYSVVSKNNLFTMRRYKTWVLKIFPVYCDLWAFVLVRDVITRGLRELCNWELHNLYFSPDAIRMISSNKMRLVGHVVHMEKTWNGYKVLVGKLKGRCHLEDLSIPEEWY